MKKMIMYFDRMEEIQLYKDVGMVPYYLAKKLNLDLEYIMAKKDIPNEFRGFKIKKIKRFPHAYYNCFFYLYLLKNAKKIDLLMTIHCRPYNLLLGFIYKILNPNGLYYIKADQNYKKNYQIQQIIDYKISFRNFKLIKILSKFITKIRYSLIKYVDLLSVEDTKTFEHILRYGISGYDVSKKIFALENGFDDYENENDYNIKEKKNIIMISGRIGIPVKNHEFLLKVLSNIDLKNWMVYFIGPVNNEFKMYYQKLLENMPLLKNKIVFTGNIKNRKQLYEYYKISKIFCLTSKNESYPLVFSEASYFGNYILTTNVGGAEDITRCGKYGQVIEQDDLAGYTDALQKLVDNPDKLLEQINDVYLRRDELTWDSMIENIKFKFKFKDL